MQRRFIHKDAHWSIVLYYENIGNNLNVQQRGMFKNMNHPLTDILALPAEFIRVKRKDKHCDGVNWELL